MLSSSFLDIAIGVTYVFLLLSLIASTVNEIILSLLNMRGRELLRGLKTLLNDPAGNGLVNKLYNHGQIFGLFEGNFNPERPGNLPSYIPATNFVSAILDVVSPSPLNSPPQQPLGPAAPARLEMLRKAAETLAMASQTEKVGKPLVAMIDSADDDIEKVRKGLEDWYNSAMDRTSGWYKYRTQRFLFCIGIVLALLLNANMIGIVQQLSRDATLRQSIVAAAQSAKPPGDKTAQSVGDQIRQAHDQVSTLPSLGIPLGWPQREDNKTWWKQNSPVLLRPGTWIGWLFTAVAVSLGAPFWFDMLNKIMVIRSTVKPREKSKEEKSKDPTKA
jgi:hypothetical protein